MNTNCITTIEEHEVLEQHLNNHRFSQAQKYLDTLSSKRPMYKTWEAYRLIGRAITLYLTEPETIKELEQIQLKFYNDARLSDFTEEQLATGNQRVQTFLIDRLKTRKKEQKLKEDNEKKRRYKKHTLGELEELAADFFD